MCTLSKRNGKLKWIVEMKFSWNIVGHTRHYMPLQKGYKQLYQHHHLTHTDNTRTSSADATITNICLLCTWWQQTDSVWGWEVQYLKEGHKLFLESLCFMKRGLNELRDFLLQPLWTQLRLSSKVSLVQEESGDLYLAVISITVFAIILSALGYFNYIAATIWAPHSQDIERFTHAEHWNASCSTHRCITVKQMRSCILKSSAS